MTPPFSISANPDLTKGVDSVVLFVMI